MKKTINLCLYLFLFIAVFPFTSLAQTMGIIRTFAGGGTGPSLGDGGPATAAYLDYPTSVYSPGTNTVIIVSANRVRSVNSLGIITTSLGDGTAGYTGDNGPATAATINPGQTNAFCNSFNSPRLLICDSWNNAIREIVYPSTIVTVLGNGTAGFGGDDGPATAALLDTPSGVDMLAHLDITSGLSETWGYCIADMSNNRIRYILNDTITTIAGNGIPGFAGDDGPATAASLDHPSDVKNGSYFDRHSFYIADWGNKRIRKVDSLGIIRTVAGNGTAGYTGDGGAATAAGIGTYGSILIDQQGTLYIAGGNTVRKIDRFTGIITTIVGNGTTGYTGDGGAATLASLSDVRGASFDDDGNLYIADAGNNCVRRVDSVGGLRVKQQQTSAGKFTLSPNPSKNMLNVTGVLSSVINNHVDLAIINVSGQIGYTTTAPVANGRIDAQLPVSGLANGTYLLLITSGIKKSAVQFVIDK